MKQELKCGGKAKMSKKKMFIGGALEVANLGLNVASAVQANIDAKNAARAASRANIRNEFLNDKEQLKTFNTTGTNTNIFAKGGRITTKAGLYGKMPNTEGGLAKVEGNIYKAVGPKHEQGGVDITPNVEVEGGEYLKFSGNDIKVISDRDIKGTIPADEFEGKMGSKDVNAAFDDEYSKQESMKKGGMAKTKLRRGGEETLEDIKRPTSSYIRNPSEANGMMGFVRNGMMSDDLVKPTIAPIGTTVKPVTKPTIKGLASDILNSNTKTSSKFITPRTGSEVDTKTLKPMTSGVGVVDDAAAIGNKFNLDNASQYIDNIGNAILTLGKPKIPEPIYAKPVSLNTEVNVNPELSNVRRTASNLRQGIRGNFANPITTSALESKIANDELMQKNELLGKKTAAETQLGNQQVVMNAQIQQQNQGLANQYNQQVTNRTQEQFGELSANLGNLQDDAAHKENIQKLTDYQDKQLYISLLTDPEGKNANAVASGLFDSILGKLSKADVDKLNIPDRLKQSIYPRLKRQ